MVNKDMYECPNCNNEGNCNSEYKDDDGTIWFVFYCIVCDEEYHLPYEIPEHEKIIVDGE